jgi:hypothetical protein
MSEHEHTHIHKKMKGNDGGGFIWCLGAIGAAVYYIQQADSFGQGVLGILKALVWPAILVYKLLQSFGM